MNRNILRPPTSSALSKPENVKLHEAKTYMTSKFDVDLIQPDRNAHVRFPRGVDKKVRLRISWEGSAPRLLLVASGRKQQWNSEVRHTNPQRFCKGVYHRKRRIRLWKGRKKKKNRSYSMHRALAKRGRWLHAVFSEGDLFRIRTYKCVFEVYKRISKPKSKCSNKNVEEPSSKCSLRVSSLRRKENKIVFIKTSSYGSRQTLPTEN